MRYIVLGLLILAVGGWIGYRLGEEPVPEDPIRVIVTELKTQAIIEHERHIAVWYKACPEVSGVNPLMFVAWPGKLSYELPLEDVVVERSGASLKVSTRALRADEPSVPTDTLDYVSTEPILNLVNEADLVNTEMRKASAIARYLATYYMKRDDTLYEDVARELRSLVLRVGSAVDSGITEVEVDIPRPDPRLPAMPALELCDGTRAAVNGLPFAKNESGYVIPIAFRTRAAEAGGSEVKPQAAAVIYGVADQKTPSAR
jgi:hypothetical protein